MSKSTRTIAIPSDHLAGLRELVFSLPYFAIALRGLHHVRFVIDSNIVLADLIWLAKTRRSHSATTALQEVVASGTVIAYAPLELREEVEKHIPRVSIEKGIPEDRLHAEWKAYQTCLHFCDGGTPDRFRVTNPKRDPNDLPFIYLYAQVGAAAVVSRDRDIQAMGAAAVRLDVIVHLREYARAKTMEVSIAVGGTVFFTGIGIAVIKLVPKLAVALAQGFARLPDWVKLALVFGAIVAVCHPKSRAALINCWHSITKKFASIAAPLTPILVDIITAYQEGQKKAAASWAQLEANLPPGQRVPLKNHVYAVCAASEKPLLLEEIARKIRIGGYHSKSRDLCSYLRRVMRRDPRFIRCADGRWTIVMAQSA